MSHMLETMAYVNTTTPWHGLGVPVVPGATVDEISAAASLNWQVERRKVRMRVSHESGEEIAIPGYCAIVRQHDNQVFQVASERYHPIQNRDTLDFFRRYCDAGDMTMETCGALKSGAVVWALAKLNGAAFTLPGNDTSEGYLLLANSHDGSMVFQAQTTSIRVVCWNTLSAAVNGESRDRIFRMKHTRKFDASVATDAKAKVAAALAQMRKMAEYAARLASVPAPPASVIQYLAQLTEPPAVKQLTTGTPIYSEGRLVAPAFSLGDLTAPGRDMAMAIRNSPGARLQSARDTWWGALNGVTYYADHEAGREADGRLASAWFGGRAAVKARALELALSWAQQ